MRPSLLALLLFLGQAAAADDHQAWWLTASFVPKGTKIEGLPVRTLHADWDAAMALRDEMLPPRSKEQGESLAEHGGALSVTMDLDHDGKPEKALVGVYRDRSGDAGRFLLILGREARGWRAKATFTQPGEAGFSVLFHQQDCLVWSTCMECDSWCSVVAADRTLKLECESCCDE